MRTIKKHEIKEYLSANEYKQFYEIYRRITALLIFSIHHYEVNNRKLIIRNFMAKSIASLQGAFTLWEIKNYQDCYVLLRVLTDRLFHLYDLIENDKFTEFDDWTFYQQFCSRNQLRSDQENSKKIIKEAFNATAEEKERFLNIQKAGITYKRPKPEKISKELDLHFLYKYGYDHASTLVHPMANDGWEDVIHLTGLYPDAILPDHRSVLSNCLLINHLLHNHAMRGLGFKWRREIVEFMDSSTNFLKTGDKGYLKCFLAIAELGATAVLCIEE